MKAAKKEKKKAMKKATKEPKSGLIPNSNDAVVYDDEVDEEVPRNSSINTNSRDLKA